MKKADEQRTKMQTWIGEFRKLSEDSQDIMKQASKQTIVLSQFYKDVQAAASHDDNPNSELPTLLDQYNLSSLSL